MKISLKPEPPMWFLGLLLIVTLYLIFMCFISGQQAEEHKTVKLETQRLYTSLDTYQQFKASDERVQETSK